MDPITVFISKALICFASVCHPVLLGSDTKAGTYTLNVLHTQQPGYGGDVLMYDSNATTVFAIHRTYVTERVQGRERLYHNTTPAQRHVTAGCVNVEPRIYEELKRSHVKRPLVIRE